MSAKPAETFRRNLSRILAQRGLTIQALADSCDMHRPNLSRILSGDEQVTLERAGRIAKALKIELSELLSSDLKIFQEIA